MSQGSARYQLHSLLLSSNIELVIQNIRRREPKPQVYPTSRYLYPFLAHTGSDSGVTTCRIPAVTKAPLQRKQPRRLAAGHPYQRHASVGGLVSQQLSLGWVLVDNKCQQEMM
jgi:hypothetical protein